MPGGQTPGGRPARGTRPQRGPSRAQTPTAGGAESSRTALESCHRTAASGDEFEEDPRADPGCKQALRQEVFVERLRGRRLVADEQIGDLYRKALRRQEQPDFPADAPFIRHDQRGRGAVAVFRLRLPALQGTTSRRSKRFAATKDVVLTSSSSRSPQGGIGRGRKGRARGRRPGKVKEMHRASLPIGRQQAARGVLPTPRSSA